ncbi:alpha/beta hydrolase [Nocardioides pantholopis]|uniref:alpha/beta hydrolase n=1 Tax=Nocardioides pantholopis TaxID=2483798 RepID=UPI000F092B84|nr:alpha/beta fold hydrolase [Nocardioides pantholopis]
MHRPEPPPVVRRAYTDLPHGQVHLRRVQPAGPTGPTDPTDSAPPLVCLHMSPASGLVYETVMAQIGRTRTVLAPDTPGFGASDPLPAYPGIGDYADVVIALVEALQLPGPVDLMGYHTGSLTAVEVARRRPDLVRRIVAVSMPVFSEAELVRFRALYSTDPIFTVDGERLLEKWRWFVEFFRVGRVNTVEHAARIFLARLSGGERHWWGHHAAFGYDVVPVLQELRTPLLVLNPDDDLTEHTRLAVPHLASGEVLEVPRWTHGFLDTAAADAAALVTAYLDSGRVPAAP